MRNEMRKETFEIGIPHALTITFETSLYNVPTHIPLSYVNGMVVYNQ